ncbi:restriction endonuclease [Flavobacterium limi]|uniref:Restriction endonuclease type IV Mrr domain-containing protein n=1 Tax=Flavobacterium limi TaxID=2045105 RepID=A0ABQ1USJ6_9FLAO|nr:restriction endonuclease [Flavobacterium limi]GGF24401.1 hypothetical protein GCM10011518_37150 [Flavobacterium limi]
MDYWLHRISYLAELSYPLLDKGFLTIGFSDFSFEEMIERTLKKEWDYFNNRFTEIWGNTPRTRYNLWYFLRFKKGDIVVVPTWGAFHICEIIDDGPLLIEKSFSTDLKAWGNKKVVLDNNLLAQENGDSYDLGFARKIKILYRNIPRDKFADSKLTARMKIRQTNANINDIKGSVIKSIENFQLNKPIHLHSILIDKTARIILDTIKTELNPDKFEKLVKLYFQSAGANQVYIPAKNERDKEGDADIVAVFENLKLIVYTQAKFQTGQISEWGTNQVLEYKTNKDSVDDGYNKLAWVITTADTFNETASNLAKQNQIQLINGVEFSKMLFNNGIIALNRDI